MNRNWTHKKLGFCYPYIKNGANIKQVANAGGYPITRIETLSGGVFNRDRMGYADVYDIERYKDYVLEDGDLLMSHINSKTYIGRTVEYKVKEDELIIHGMNLLRLKGNDGSLLSSFFAYYTQSNSFKSDVARIRKDAVNQSSFAIYDLRNFDIPVPPIDTQKAVVEELDQINALIAIKEKQLRELEELEQTIFHEMFGDPITNKRWEKKKIREMGLVKTGNTPRRSVKSYYSSKDIEWIKTDNIVRGQLYATQAEEYLSEEGAMVGRISKAGSVLVACIAGSISSIGKACLLDRDAAFNQQINSIEPNDSILGRYLYGLLDASSNYIQTKASNGMKHILSKSAFEEIELIVPPIDKQQEYIDCVAEIDSMKMNASKTIKDLEELFFSRMQYWFD